MTSNSQRDSTPHTMLDSNRTRSRRSVEGFGASLPAGITLLTLSRRASTHLALSFAACICYVLFSSQDLFLKFVRENNGYFPVRIEALPEGTVANVHVPVYQIFAEGEYARL